MSKQGVSSQPCYSDKHDSTVDKGGCSHHCSLPQPIQHPHHHLVTYQTVERPSLDGLLKPTTAVELSPQNANMVRLAPDRCHARAISRMWVATDTYHQHPQHAIVLFLVCLAVCQLAHAHVIMMAFIAASCKARQEEPTNHDVSWQLRPPKTELKSLSMGQLNDSHGKTFLCTVTTKGMCRRPLKTIQF